MGVTLLARRDQRDEAKREERLAKIEELENEIFERAAGVVNAYLSFAEVERDQKEPPPAWVAQYGYDAAKQRLEVAKAGWLPASIAPAAAKLAVQAQIGISRGRGYRMKITQNNLNVKIALPAPTSSAYPANDTTYEVRDLET